MLWLAFSGSGKSTLSLLIGQLYKTSSGSLTIGGKDVQQLSKLDIALNVSSVTQHPFIFTGTIRDNLLYATSTLYLNNLLENLPDNDDLFDIIREVGLAVDVVRWGLRAIIHPKRATPLIPSFLQMRQIFRDKLGDEFNRVIEFYNADKFLEYSPIAINIIFGSYGGSYSVEKKIKNKEFRTFLVETALEEPLIELGLTIARSTIGFLGDFKNDEFFFQGSPMNPSQFQHYEKLCRKVENTSLFQLKKDDQDHFLALALGFTPGFHKITTISVDLKQKIVNSRKLFLETIGKVDLALCANGNIQTDIMPPTEDVVLDDQGYTPFCSNQYLMSHSLLDNILFGTVIDQELVREKLVAIAREEFERFGLIDDIMDIGLDYHVGSKGDNLSGGQKQKIALARAFLKNSPVLVLDEATASLDNSSQAKIQNFIETKLRGKTTVVAVVHRLDMISGYDHIIVMKDGKIVESGNYQSLVDQKGILYDLINDR